MRKSRQNEKRTTVGIAMAISFLVVVTVSGFFYANRAYAKETLQGIKKVVEESKKKDHYGEYESPFVILEVIPDFVQRTFTVSDIDGQEVSIGLNIDIGSIGYYVKGEEPSTVNLKNALEAKAPADNGLGGSQNGAQGSTEGDYILKDATARKNMANIILDPTTDKEEGKTADRGFGYLITEREMPAGAVEGVFYREFNDGYREVRLGEVLGDGYTHSYTGSGKEETYREVTVEMMDKLQEDKTFIALPRDYPGEHGERYIDAARGIMTKVSDSASDKANKGNFTLSYEPKLVEKEIDGMTVEVLDTDIANKTADPAYWFVASGQDSIDGNPFAKYKKADGNNENTGNEPAGNEANGQSNENKGEYDPYFVLPFTGEEATHRAVFDYVGSVRSGYEVVDNHAVANPNDPAQVKPGTPIYTLDETGKMFVFVGYAGTIQQPVGKGMEDGQGEESEKKENTDEEKKDSEENTVDKEKKDNEENTVDKEKKDSEENTVDKEKKDNEEDTVDKEKKDSEENTGDKEKKGSEENTEDKGDQEKKNAEESVGKIADVSTERIGSEATEKSAEEVGRSSENGSESDKAVEETGTEGQPSDGAGNKTEGQPAGGSGNETADQPSDGAGNGTEGQPADGAGNGTEGQPTDGTGNETADQPSDGAGNGTEGQPAGGAGNGTEGQPVDGTDNGTESQPADGTGNETGDGAADQTPGETVTDPADGTGVTPEGNPDGEKKDDGNPDGKQKDEPAKEPGYEQDTFGEEAGARYFTVQFAYVPNNRIGDGLYQVSAYDIDVVNGYKEYMVNDDIDGAIVPNPNGTGVITLVDANRGLIEDRLIYDYTPGQGAFQWTGEAWLSQEGKDLAGKCRIRGAQIYYSTGLINRDFFKRHVLDRELKECDELPISVVTKPAADVTVDDINSAKLLVIQRGEPYYGCADTLADEEGFAGFPMYSVSDLDYRGRPRDFTSRTISDLIVNRKDAGLAIISDYGMFDVDKTNHDENETHVFNVTRSLIRNDDTAVVSLGNYNNVIKAVYNVTFGPNLNQGLVNTDFQKEIPKKGNDDDPDEREGFQPVLDGMQNERIFRMASHQKPLTNSKLSQATIIRYIIAYASEPEYDQKGSLHILELAPCASYTLHLVTTGDGSKENPKVTKLYKITSTIKDGEHKGEIDKEEELIEFKSGDVTLTQMTTSEFIGHVDDINAIYDMIYIGSGTGPYKLNNKENGTVVEMNHDSEGKTVYNDESMNGLIYSNIGDTYTTAGIKRYSAMTKGFNNDIEQSRFSGNDITEEKVRALQEFIDAGFPVVVSDELAGNTYAPVEEGKREPLFVRQETVDQSSNLYAFLRDNRDRLNLFLLSEVTGPLLNMYLNVGRPKLTLLDGMTAQGEESIYVLPADSNGNFRAVFEFNVDTVGIGSDDVTYNFELYIDINADGKFSKTNEKIAQTQITVEDLAGNPVATDDQGRYMMQSGQSYRATYVLSASQRGVVPWRIRVIQNDETNLRRADATGYYEVRDPGGKAEDIHVLQILNNAWPVSDKLVAEYGENYRDDPNFEKDHYDEINKLILGMYDVTYTKDKDGKDVRHEEAGHNWNMEKSKNDPNTSFAKLLSDKSAVPFNVSIDAIPYDYLSVSYHAQYLEKKLGADRTMKDVDGIYGTGKEDFLAFFRNYDMLVIGFGDAFRDLPDPMLEAIKIYAEEGRSILFTHDNTSPFTYTSSSDYSYDDHGHKFNQYLRDAFGLNRYNSYVEGDQPTWAESDTFQIEKAYKPKSERHNDDTDQYVPEAQGLTYTTMHLYARYAGDRVEKIEKPYLSGMLTTDFIKYDDYDASFSYRNTYSTQWETRHVQSVNSGQITRYPYKLRDDFEVATTHGQWWQLDFTRDEDHDGESDLVVWYTLSGSDLYDMSPRDVRNNYYIFNMGNITYTGVGHRKVLEADAQGHVGSEDEMKLFINTLIAAYQSGLHDPEIKIIENYNPQSRDVSSFYVSYDEALKGVKDSDVDSGMLDKKEDIYFVANSTSLVRTNSQRKHRLSAELYVEVPTSEGAETLAIKGGSAYGKKIDIESLKRMGADGKTEVEVPRQADGSYTIEGGVVYKATVPMAALKYYSNGKTVFDDETNTDIPNDGSVVARNSRRIMVVATESISYTNSDGKTTETKTMAMDSIKAMRLRVFDMD